MTREAVEELEMKVAFLERASAELGDEVYRQRKEIDELRTRLATLAGRIEAAAGIATDPSSPHERPPHY
jgi:uncharacterized coiled-coil protein SlyX